MPEEQNWQFAGVTSPNTTQVPDQYFDELLPVLSGAELKVLLYITRRTFGFKKDSDNISLSQMLHGIKTKDGHVLDRGVGLSKKTLLHAIRSLADKNIILTERRQSPEKGNEATTYRLNIITPPLGVKSTLPLGEKVHQGVGVESPPSPRGRNSPIQQTVLQETVLQHHQSRSYSTNSAQTRESGDDVLDLLTHHGISSRAAKALAKQYPAAQIREKVEIFEYLRGINSSLVAKNPPGWLRLAIEENYYPPADYLQAKAGEERRRQVEQEHAQTAADELRRRAQELTVPPQERAERSLRAWERARERMSKPPLAATERTEWIRNQVAQFTKEREEFFAEQPDLLPAQPLSLAGDSLVSPALVTDPLLPRPPNIPNNGPVATKDRPRTLIFTRADPLIAPGGRRRFRATHGPAKPP